MCVTLQEDKGTLKNVVCVKDENISSANCLNCPPASDVCVCVCVSFPLYSSCPPPVGLLTWTISTEVKPLVVEALFLILILFKVISATSARSSASSSSWIVFLYLDRLVLACSSYRDTRGSF